MNHHWSKVNISPAEDAARVTLGAAPALAGSVLAASAPSPTALAFDLVLVATSFEQVMTGAPGHCPPCARLGHVPASLRHPEEWKENVS
ncbi:MAG: DUF2892 domain-containing protein [Nocardioidaceae bacterium]|nr:DUF2892 domain-containing protein [Nocardioidaceae bacterium]